LENKALEMNASRFDLVVFTRNVYLLFSDKSERKKIAYEFQSEFESLDVFMDLRKIETILFNLIFNAFKFTGCNGKIKVSINHDDSLAKENTEPRICITVSDTGIGISEEDQQKVFSRFFQTKEARRMERGSGIGLTLVDEYVKMHNGRIVLESEPGKGSTFKIILPLQKENFEEKSPAAEGIELGTMLREIKQADLNNGHHIQFPVKGKPTILLVEDENDIVDFIALCFRGKYNLMIANNGKEALQKIATQVPDLVISDIMMPKMDGIAFTKKFKSNPKTAHVPLILLTGQSQPEKQLEGLKSGADAFVTKPFEIELLEVRINNFLKRREQLIEYFRIDNLSNPMKIDIASQDEKWLERIVNCIENNISEPDFSISILSEQTGISTNSLYRKIKNLTGHTTNDFIRTVRIRRAEQLLRTKKFTIAEVMYQTGFSNHSYFSKCFRKVYKMAPREYIEKV
jgi:DNA-binding response OmpR family regulator/anti-sigma regulatory factor (Ser/Thr protein kinase)